MLSDAEGKRDVVCGMTVPSGNAAARRKREEVEYVFCSLSCAEKFDEQPRLYLESSTE